MRSTTLVKLHRYKIKRKGGNPYDVWKLVWYGLRDGVRTKFQETIGTCKEMTKRQANLLRAEKENAVNNGQLSPNKSRKMGLAEYLEYDRQEATADSKPRTIAEMKVAADHAIRTLGARYPIQSVDFSDVQRIKTHLKSRGLKPATCGKVVLKLSAAFNRAVKRDLILANPFTGTKLPKWQSKTPQTYSLAEVDAMVAVAPNLWWETFIRLACTSGLRQGELLNLLWSDVDPERSEVQVARKDAGTFEAHGETFPILEWDAKDYDARTLSIPPDVVARLQRLRTQSGGSAYVFLTLDRLRAIQRYMDAHGGELSAGYKLVNNLMRDFKEIQTAARRHLANQAEQDDYEWPMREFHDLRRTFGTIMSEHVSVNDLRVLMGHSSITTTQKFYLRPSENLAEKARQAFASGA